MVKIALLSDIHFGKDSRCSDFAIPGQQIVDDVSGGNSLYGGLESKLLEYKPDYILCTGDLTSSGKPLEFKYCLEKLYGLAEKVSVPKQNVIYCIGNHDVDWALIAHSSKPEEYEKLNRDFASDESAFLSNYYSSVTHSWLQHMQYIPNIDPYHNLFSSVGPIPMTGLIERDDFVIFVLNSGFLCSSKQEIIHGKISTAQLEWLESELQNHVSTSKWKIIILHHHPFAYEYPIVYPEYSTLEEGPQLQRLCGQYGVNLVVHGHYHYPTAKTRCESGWNNPVTFISSGSLSVNQAGRMNGGIPNTFHYIQLERYPNVIKLITYEYSLGSGWHEVSSNRDALPLDHEMFFGELAVDDCTAKEFIKRFPVNTAIAYKDIDPRLKYIAPSHLNKLLIEVHGLDLSGSFPGSIKIHSSGKEEQSDE